MAVLGLLVLTWAIGGVLSAHPNLVESLYINVLYCFYRKLWYGISWLSPFPLIYVWLFFILGWIVVLIWRLKKSPNKWKSYLTEVFYFLAVHCIWFYWAWGFCYHRKSLRDRLDLSYHTDSIRFLNECLEVTARCNTFRARTMPELSYAQLESETLLSMQDLFGRLSLPYFPAVRSRQLWPQGVLLVWSTAGIYLPFSGEAQIDAGLHSLQKPFTLAHEIAHVMGWTDEGECNFLAYLVCQNSSDFLLQYSAELTYWKYLASNARRKHPEWYRKMYSALSDEVKSDLHAVEEQMQKFPDFLPGLRDWLYNWYLKLHGVQSGTNSYYEMVNWIIAFKDKQKKDSEGKF